MFKWFGNLKIGVRIIIVFFIITVISCIIGVVGIFNLKNVQDSYAVEYTSSTKALEHVEGISSHFQQSRVNIFGYALSPDSEEEKAYYIERIAQHESDVDKHISSYFKILDAYDANEVEAELMLINNVKTTITEFKTMKKQLMDKLETGSISKEEFVTSFSKGGKAHDLASNGDSAIEELIEYNLTY